MFLWSCLILKVFDISSFQPLGFGFADTVYYYKETDTETIDIDLRPEKDIIVRVTYSLDEESGVLNWKFLTLDPNTFQLIEKLKMSYSLDLPFDLVALSSCIVMVFVLNKRYFSRIVD